MSYLITTKEEYDYLVQKGINPLLDDRNFQMEISLRIQIQRDIFGHCAMGRGNVPAANERYFRWMWENKPHYCEECMKPLNNYSAVYCSHILTRGSRPEAAHDPRNMNLLCFKHHNQWEVGDRESMRIYPRNLKTIDLIKSEYQGIRL